MGNIIGVTVVGGFVVEEVDWDCVGDWVARLVWV